MARARIPGYAGDGPDRLENGQALEAHLRDERDRHRSGYWAGSDAPEDVV